VFLAYGCPDAGGGYVDHLPDVGRVPLVVTMKLAGWHNFWVLEPRAGYGGMLEVVKADQRSQARPSVATTSPATLPLRGEVTPRIVVGLAPFRTFVRVVSRVWGSTRPWSLDGLHEHDCVARPGVDGLSDA
jgi:hypothetical protein